MESTVTPIASSTFLALIEERSGQKVKKCYQCGKCTAGCPAAFAMDLTPRQVMRALQLGLKEEVLNSSSIWVCVYCHTCSVRCPLEIEIDKVMETLRLVAVAEKRPTAQKNIALFHSLFLSGIKHTGRIFELALGGIFNLRSRQPFLNVGRAPSLFWKGKLPLLPARVKGTKEISSIIARVEGGSPAST
jgi:heterodisulfide reductase subunit C